MTALFASRPSYTKSTSLPLLPARLLSQVRSARSLWYDEGMNDVPDPSPIGRLVRFAQRGEPFPAEILKPLDLDVSENPF
jgi:hypothetical protein